MKTQQISNIWVTCPNPNPKARIRLFCLPYAGRGASSFRTWSNDLPPEFEVCPIQLPGRENRLKEPPLTQISQIVKALAPLLDPYLDLPFAFFGHSMGALICFELSREIRRVSNSSPIHLFISGCPAPQKLDLSPPIHELPASQFVEELCRRYNCIIPESVQQNTELMQLFLPALRADLATGETYVYTHEAPLNCPISLFGGLQDEVVSQEALEAWREQTHNSVTVRMFPGNHFFINSVRSSILTSIAKMS